MFTKHLLSKLTTFHLSIKVSMVILLLLATLQHCITLRTVFCLDHNFLKLRRLKINISVKGNSFFSTGVTLHVFLNTYLPQALSQYIVHYMICSDNDSSDRQHPKSITVWLSVSKNKFYTLTKVWGRSCKGPATYYFPGIAIKNHGIDHIEKERIITHSRIKILEELWMLISRNRCLIRNSSLKSPQL